jgi:hypothetical protein
MIRQGDSWFLFLRYQAREERHDRRSVEEFEGLGALQAKLPNEPILDVQSVEPFHLFRYLDERAFRYNNRKGFTDKDRFDMAVRQIVGKRLTWNQSTGKTVVAQA